MTISLETLDAAIQEAAVSGIASVTTPDGQTTTTKSLSELIEWRKQLKAEEAAARPTSGLRLGKFTPQYDA